MTRVPFRVRFSDTDAMGIVHHARYFDYFEFARVEYMRNRDVHIVKIVETGHQLPVTEAHVRFDRPARFDDPLIVEIRLASATRARVRFAYRLLGAPPDAGPAVDLASGWSDHVYTGLDLTLRRFPRDFLDRLLDAERGATITAPPAGQSGRTRSDS